MEAMSFTITYSHQQKKSLAHYAGPVLQLVRNLLNQSVIAFAFSIFLTLVIGSWLAAAEQTLEQRLMAERPEALAESARKEGDAKRGAFIFHRSMMTCTACHSVGEVENSLGPNLAKLNKNTTDAAIVESILQPSKVIAPAFASLTIETFNGRVVTGLPIEETDEKVVLSDAANIDKLITINKQDIEQRFATEKSIMPVGQVDLLADRQHFLDLVRYLLELRDGGIERALELQPAVEFSTALAPEVPLPWKPVVQRGELAVDGNTRYPRAVSLGFVDGTVLFDADQLATAVVWFDGFVKSSPQPYFGLYWHHSGGAADKLSNSPHPLRFKLADQVDWQPFEPSPESDPNIGSRFDGYQIGTSTVRLKYRVLVGKHRICVTEDVRAVSHGEWDGFVRQFQFTGLPAGAQVSMAMPDGESFQFCNATGEPIDQPRDVENNPLIVYQSGGFHRVVRANSPTRATWLVDRRPDQPKWRLVSAIAIADKPLAMRIDMWKYRDAKTKPTAEQLAALDANAPHIDTSFDAPQTQLVSPSVSQAIDFPIVERPAVTIEKNVDEFPSIKARFLRFVVTRTHADHEPCIDELEVYGTDEKQNLALSGKASASSAISGYPIHQIPHLNDGVVGNEKSWISAEKGGGWAQIEFPETVEISKVVWSKDRTGKTGGRLVVAYRIDVSSDGKRWIKVSDEAGRIPYGTPSTPIQRDASPGYVMESIPKPFAECRPSDIIFSDDGMMYAIAMTQGQIWRTPTPPVGQPTLVQWQRFATGLHHPIGLALVNKRLYVAQKPEITELIDADGNGIVEQYRTVATGWGLSPGWHEYCFGLAVDPQQNLWFALNTGRFWTHPGTELVAPGRWRGSIMRVDYGTEKLEVAATGCRVPNGIGQGPEGKIFFTDNQGDWIQSCKLAHVVPGRFYGHPEYEQDALPKDDYPNGRSAVWLPYDKSRNAHSRSASGPVFDSTQGKFGPFAGQMFVGDVGYGANSGIMRIALEKVEGEYQGACFRFVDGQPLGCERMRFGPDNQLYMSSLTSGLTRMAFDGKTPMAIHSLNIRPQGEGFVVHLTKPLADDLELDPAQFSVRRYHYLYTRNYGSPEADQKQVPVESVKLSPDRKSITLKFPVETYPIGMVYEFNVGKLTSADGEVLMHNQAWYTVHNIPK
jgi:putative heme-binding domain-containing protein